jgi:hypothetical protein
MKLDGGLKRTASLFFISTLGGRQRSDEKSSPSIPKERAPVANSQEAGWAPEPVWDQLRKENLACPCSEQNTGSPVRVPLLYRLNWTIETKSLLRWRPWRLKGLCDDEDSTLARQSAQRWPQALSTLRTRRALLPRKIILPLLVLVSVRGWANSRI